MSQSQATKYEIEFGRERTPEERDLWERRARDEYGIEGECGEVLELEADPVRRARYNVIGTVLECSCRLEGGDCVRYGGDDCGDRGGAEVGHCYPAGDPIYAWFVM